MDDAEYIFHQTNNERRRNGRGAFNKVRQGGRHVRMPSDNLTKRERNKMNGAVVCWDMGKPMEWPAFRKMPDDLKKKYVDGLKERFPGINGILVASAVGTSRGGFSSYCSTHGLSFFDKREMNSSTFYKTKAGEEFTKWLKGEKVCESDIPDEPDEVIEEAVEEPVAPVVESVSVAEKEPTAEPVKSNGVDLANIAFLLRSLAGSGAKLTIEIVL